MGTITRLRSATHRSAFTLMELLVVISIIAILAAMLLPAINLVRESSKGARCLSNQRQLALAYAAYAADHDGWIPPPQMDGGITGGEYGYWGMWCGYLQEYLSNGMKLGAGEQMQMPVFQCPSQVLTPAEKDLIDWKRPVRSYGANYAFDPVLPAPGRASFEQFLGFPLSRIPGQSQTIVLADRYGEVDEVNIVGGVVPPYIQAAMDPATGLPANMGGISVLGGTVDAQSIRLSHRGRFSLSCFDGHAELAQPVDTVMTPCPASGAVKPNRWTATY